MTIHEAKQKNPLQLAYLGDAVYELKVRTMLLSSSDLDACELHKSAVSRVCAAAQHEALERINDILSDEEKDIVRRGKNATKAGVPRSSSPRDYRAATGMEALFGYLYLTDNAARIDELFSLIAEKETSV